MTGSLCGDTLEELLETFQNAAARVLTGTRHTEHIIPISDIIIFIGFQCVSGIQVLMLTLKWLMT